MGREKERKKDTGLGRTPADNSDKLSAKDRTRARLYIRSLVSIKRSPSARRAPNLPGPIYIYIYAFSRRFCPKRLTVNSGYIFFVSMHLLPFAPVYSAYTDATPLADINLQNLQDIINSRNKRK